MMDTIGEEDSLGICHEAFPLLTFACSGVALQYVFDCMPDGQVVPEILVPGDVPAPLGGFGQMIGVLLLAQGKCIPSRYAVAHHLDVCK